MTDNITPVFNLKTVVMQTGLTPSTLRAWERRYGIPSPGRSAGRQRLYSERDIRMLQWLNARLQEGLRIRQAVDRWRSLENQGTDPLTESSTQLNSLSAPSSVEGLRNDWLKACSSYDETSAERILSQAFALYPVEVICTQILQAGLRSIGEDWYKGKASIQQEHFTSALAMRKLEILFAAAPPAVRPQTILVGTPSGEWHTFPALLLVLFLRRRGFHVIYLGADLPSSALIESVHQVKPDLVVLSAQTLVSAASLLSDARNIAAEGIPLGYGGWIFTRLPEITGMIPAHYLGDDLEAAILLSDHIAVNPVEPQPTTIDNPSLQSALAVFHAGRTDIENDVVADPTLAGIDRNRLWNANLYLGNDLAAALELGSMDYLAVDLQWVRDLLGQSPLKDGELANYLAAFRRALQGRLGKEGEIITSWEGWEEILF